MRRLTAITVLHLCLPLLLLTGCGGADRTTAPQEESAGPERWSANVETSPVERISGSTLVLLSTFTNTLAALDGSTGAQRWTRTPPRGALSAITAGDEVLVQRFVADSSIAGTVLDAATGADLWTIPEFPRRLTYLLTVGGTMILQATDTTVVAFNRRTGQERWRANLPTVSCTGLSFCNNLQAIGVDGTQGFLLRRSERDARVLTVSETGIVREVVAPSKVLQTVFNARSQTAVVKGTGLVVAWSDFDAATAVDAATGAVRWQTSYASLGTRNPEPIFPKDSWYTPDGARLLLRFYNIDLGLDQRVLDTSTGSVVSSRSLTAEQVNPDLFAGCGADGWVQVTATGIEYTNLRTGIFRSVSRPGLVAVTASGGRRLEPLGADRVLVTGGSPLIGLRCLP